MLWNTSLRAPGDQGIRPNRRPQVAKSECDKFSASMNTRNTFTLGCILHPPDATPNLCIAARWLAAVFAGRFLPKLGGVFGHRLFFTGASDGGTMNIRISAWIIALTIVAAGGFADRVYAADAPRPCPASIGIVDRTVGPTLIYLGTDPASPEICRMKRGDMVETFHFGIWSTAWPGADAAAKAIKQVYAGPAGTTVTFDVSAGPGLQWHDTIVNGGTEDLRILGRVYRTLRVVHEREGFDGNTYHSIITSWRDIESGMAVYQNYQHISGRPEPGAAWDAVSITGGD